MKFPAAAFCALVAQGTAAPAAAQTRTFELVYQADLASLPTGARDVKLWLPLAQDDAQQRIRMVHVESPIPTSVVHEPAYGNAALHLRPTGPVRVTVRYVVDRRAESHRDVAARARAEVPLDGEVLGRWLRPPRLGQLGGKVRSYAERATAGKRTAYDKIHGIYDFVFETMRYDKTGTGWGKGDLVWACDRKRGNCTDFHTLFVAMASVAKVPARFEIGLPLPRERGEGAIPGYHCWARFFLEGVGWLPVDVSEARKDPSRKETLFGGHDENRVQFTVGRDLRYPGMAGELNYFIHPYAEADGRAIPVGWSARYRDL